MAQFNYQAYEAKNASNPNNGNNANRPKVHFMGEFLKNDGDFAIVRFPYSTMNDLLFESVHKVMGVFPNNVYGKFVSCSGDDTCPLCKHPDEATRKTIMKFYAKMVVYTVNNGTVTLNPTVWERPSMFGDSDLKNLMTEYGDLTKHLFKITRNGSGTNTRYNILPVLNTTVYPENIYVKDFSCINDIDPVKILAKTIAQYNEALNPGSTQTNTTSTQPAATTVSSTPVEQAATQATATVAQTPVAPTAQVVQPNPTVAQAPVQPTQVTNVTPVTNVAPSTQPAAPGTRYKF